MLTDIAELVVKVRGGFFPYRKKMLECKIKPLQIFLRNIYYLNQKGYGCFIGHTAKFKSEPCFPHNLHGIFIAGGANFGENCVIFHHVTVGSNSMPFSSGVGSPTIGDNCFIGAGATIVGNVTIGNNVRIGANCTVFTDVPDNSIVVTDKPRVITKDEPLVNRYYRWSPDGPVYYENGQWLLEKDQAVIDSIKYSL